MSSKTKLQAMSTQYSLLYTRGGGGTSTPSPEPSWAILVLVKQVPHQSSELDMQTSHHPFIHGIWPHAGGGDHPDIPRVVFIIKPVLWARWV